MQDTSSYKTGDVRQTPEGDWQEFVNGKWYDWSDRPLCSCKVEDDGDGESGPHLSIVERDPFCERHPAERFYIHKYEVSLCYGGPEEGGWHFKCGTPVRDWQAPTFDDKEYAFAICRELNDSERERAKREEKYEFTSVLAYQSQHFEYDVSADETARAFPEHRPHYE